MPEFVATRSDPHEVVQYVADVPAAEHLAPPWTVEEIVPLVAPPDAPAGPPPVLTWNPFVFMRRFEPPERVAIRAARRIDPVLDDFFSMLEAAPELRSDDPDFQAGMAYLVQQNLLTAQRAAEIVSA